jgi:hypothetical protein
MLRHVPRVSVEEFIDAEEFTYDTICANGQVLFENICRYTPRPLQTMQHEWISPVTMALRNMDASVPPGRARTRRGRAEVARLPGRVHPHGVVPQVRRRGRLRRDRRPAAGWRTVDVMNYATDADLFSAWADAVTHGQLSQPIERRYNAASIFKRAKGLGRITHYEGLDQLMAQFGEHVAAVDLLPIGRAAAGLAGNAGLRRDGDRPASDLPTAVALTERFATDLQLYAS